MTGASKTVSSQDLLRNASLCYFVGWRNRSSQSRLKENSTGLKVSASMSSEPLLFLKHADATRQNSVRIWEVRQQSGWWETLSSVIAVLSIRTEGVPKPGPSSEYRNSATGELAACDLLTLFTLLLTFSRAELYKVLVLLLFRPGHQ